MEYLFRFLRKGRVARMTIQTPVNAHAKVRTWPVVKARATSRLKMTAAIIPATYSPKVTNKAAASGDGATETFRTL